MSYIVISQWDEANNPTKTKIVETVEDAELYTQKAKDLPDGEACPNAFWAEVEDNVQINFIKVNQSGNGIVVDDVAQSENAKKELKASLAHHRWLKENAGVNFNNVTIQTDRDSRANLMVNSFRAQENPTEFFVWKTKDGFINFSAAEMIDAANASAAHVEQCFEAEYLVEIKIDDGTFTTVNEVTEAFDAQFV